MKKTVFALGLTAVLLLHPSNVRLQQPSSAWVHFHGPDQREFSIVTDTETLKLGRMSPVNTNTPGSWDTKVETLEIRLHKTFRKIAHFADS
jgi:hypothetical protein